jgi:alkylhydroperoxidase family enzyme
MSSEMHGRLPWLEPSDLDEAQRLVYSQIVAGPRAQKAGILTRVDDQGRLEGPFNAMLVSPVIGNAIQNLGQVARFESKLSSRTREMVILTVAHEARCDFEWYAHALIGKTVGLTAEQIDAVMQGQEPDGLDPAEELSLRTATALLLSGDLDDHLFAQARDGLGVDVVTELLVLVAYYQLMATLLRVWRTPLPKGVVGPFSPPSAG